jgi:hypothetical protein
MKLYAKATIPDFRKLTIAGCMKLYAEATIAGYRKQTIAGRMKLYVEAKISYRNRYMEVRMPPPPWQSVNIRTL